MTDCKTGHLRAALPFIAVLLFFVLAAGEALAAGSGAQKWDVTLSTDFEYTDNVYKLSSTQADRLDAGFAADKTSGRFNDMESVGDFVISPAFTASTKLFGIGGKDLKIKPSVKYNLYAKNSEKNYLQFSLDLTHELTSTSSLGMDVGYKSDVFKKNHMSDVTDFTGNVSADERVYSPAVFDDLILDFTYRRRLWKRSGRGSSGVKSIEGKALLGLEDKAYDAPFLNRDESTIRAGAALGFAMASGTDFTVKYLFELVDTPVSSEVMIRNETDFGVDFNGDADALDLDRRTVQDVDRSRHEHTLSFKGAKKFSKEWSGSAKYDIRLQTYQSKETFDITRRDRKDIRHRVGFGLERKLTGGWSLDFGGGWTEENAGRDALAATDADETKSYDVLLLSAAISYRP